MSFPPPGRLQGVYGMVVLLRHGHEVARWPLGGPPDLLLVDELARLALTGLTVRLVDPPAALRELLRLCGLLRWERHGQAEVGEQLGVQETVQPDDRTRPPSPRHRP
jgi:hypothetical protein